MPILRYFVFVGGALLALLFVCDAVLPQVPLPSTLRSASDLPAVRIRSDRKWPERVVIDTSIPTTSPVTVARADSTPSAAIVADVRAKAGAREAFAQMGAAELKSQLTTSSVSRIPDPALTKLAEATAPKSPEVKTDAKPDAKTPPKRRVAVKVRPSRPMILVAQQPQSHAGWFDSTW
jgi:hypothetical protein